MNAKESKQLEEIHSIVTGIFWALMVCCGLGLIVLLVAVVGTFR